jgi:hypothetical protein
MTPTTPATPVLDLDALRRLRETSADLKLQGVRLQVDHDTFGALVAEVELSRQARQPVPAPQNWATDLEARLIEASKSGDSDDDTKNLLAEAACLLKMCDPELATLRTRNAELEHEVWCAGVNLDGEKERAAELERLADDLADKVKGLEAQLRCVAANVAKKRGEVDLPGCGDAHGTEKG